MTTLVQLAGQLLTVGFSGTSLPPEVERSLSEGELGGVILFRRNLPDLATTHALCSAIRRASGDSAPPFIGVDQEGGRVARLPSPARKLPPLRALGRIGDADLARRAGAAVGAELAALGFNLDFAPVLDVDSNPENPVIGDRSLSHDPAEVARLALAFAAGLGDAGILACGKHFPGHGDTSQDSHFTLPRVRHDRARLDAVELAPFAAAARAPLPSLMTAHVVYDALDAGVPATLSAAVCTRLLRDELGFSGVLFSDDLEMRALSEHCSVEENAVRAVRAGADALLVCSDVGLARRAAEALGDECRRDAAFLARCEQAFVRVLAARRTLATTPCPSFDDAEAVLAEGRVARIIQEIESRTTT